MTTCALAPADKRIVARRVGNHLIGLYGRRRAYSPPLIRAAMRRCQFPDVWDCWALSLYASREDFDAWHAQTGEACEYAAMHSEMLDAIGAAAPISLDGADAATNGGWFDWLEGLSADIDISDHTS